MMRTMNSKMKAIKVHTLCYSQKLTFPAKLAAAEGANVETLRQWTAEKLHFPAAEATLIAGGKALDGSLTLQQLVSQGTLDVHLVCTTPAAPTKMKVYIKDTTRVPNKMYAVKMEPSQTIQELKQKLFDKSSCTVRPRQQRLLCRGKVADGKFSLREYTLSQRDTRVIFYLSRDTECLDDEELTLSVKIPSNTFAVKTTLTANQTVLNLRQILERSHGIKPARYSLLNSAGLVLQDQMTIRTACTMPKQWGNGQKFPVGLSAGAVVPSLFAVPIPAERLTRGMTNCEVYLNPEHHATLGITYDSARAGATTGRGKKQRPKAKAAGQSTNNPFKGIFKKKGKLSVSVSDSDSSSQARVQAQAVAPQTNSKNNVDSTNTDSDAKKRRPKAKKPKGNSYKNSLKALMKSRRGNDESIAAHREKISRSVGGGMFRRVDSI